MGKKAPKRQLQTRIPGVGFIFQPPVKNRKTGEIYRKFWSIRLTDGTQKSTGLEDQQEAFDQLLKAGAAKQAGTLSTLRGSIGELLEFSKGKALKKVPPLRSLADKLGKIKILKAAFGTIKVSAFCEDPEGYLALWLGREQMRRKGQKGARGSGLSDATKNRYLEVLTTAFNQGMKAHPKLCEFVPELPHYDEDNVREVMLDRGDYERLRDAFTVEHARLFFVLGYHLGMRSGEIKNLKWDQVDFGAGLIRLKMLQTKGKKARIAPIYGDMREHLVRAKRSADAECQFVIQWEGRKVEALERSWGTATRAAGLGGFRPHDLRRTAVSNMLDAGISGEIVMRIIGHKSQSMMERYHITSERMALAAGKALEDNWKQHHGKKGKEKK